MEIVNVLLQESLGDGALISKFVNN